MTLQELSKHSTEFGELEYLVQLMSRSPTIKLESAINVSNPALRKEFQRYDGVRIIRAWVNDLTGINSYKNVIEKGISIPKSGIIIFQEPEISMGSQTLLHVLAAVGRVYSTNTENPPKSCPRGFDSVTLTENRFIIYEKTRILPLYFAKFNIGTENSESKQQICEYCEEKEAKKYCIEEKLYLCKQCDIDYHGANRLLQRHHRVQVSEYHPRDFGYCRAHLTEKIEFFCPTCKIPVCIHCKMIGSHSNGEAASHSLIPVQRAYSEAIEAASEIDPRIKKRKESINSQLKKVRKRISDVSLNAKTTKERIESVCEGLIRDVEKAEKCKLIELKSDETALIQQQKEISNLISFVELQCKSLEPMDFLTAFSRLQKVSNNLKNDEDIRRDINVKPDITIEGSINIKYPKILESFQVDETPTKLTTSLRRSLLGSLDETPEEIRSQIISNITKSTAQKSWRQRESIAPLAGGGQLEPIPLVGEDQLFITDSTKVETDGEDSDTVSDPFDSPTNHRLSESPIHSTPISRTLNTPIITPTPILGSSRTLTPNTPTPILKSSRTLTPKTPIQKAKEKLASLGTSPSLNSIRQLPYSISMLEEAEKRENALISSGHEVNLIPFSDSEILDESLAAILFLSIPFKKLPRTVLLYSSEKHERNVKEIHRRIDGKGPTVIIMNNKEGFVFGGFASESWNRSRKYFGNYRSFLFNITLDTKIPYISHSGKKICLWGGSTIIRFGQKDLVLVGNLERCSTELENAYGIGHQKESIEAKTFLCGSKEFSPTTIEVYGFVKRD